MKNMNGKLVKHWKVNNNVWYGFEDVVFEKHSLIMSCKGHVRYIKNQNVDI